MPIPCIPGDFRSYLENAIDFARTFTMTTPGYISFRLWNLDGTAKADQRLRNQFILETLEQAYHLAQPIDAYVGKVHGNAIAPHTYVNFDQLFEWPDEHAPDYGFNGTCHGLRHQLAILADGQVVPCCLDHNGHLALGNIFIESLIRFCAKKKVSESSKTSVLTIFMKICAVAAATVHVSDITIQGQTGAVSTE